MLPYLRSGDFDGALAAALTKVDAAASPEHAADLQRARQFNAVLGLVGAPIVFLGLSGWAFFHWRRYGKDPVYLDDPSVLMPAPPPDLTAASGRDGHGRLDVPAGADDRDARPRVARPHRVPRGIGRAARARRQEGRDRHRPGRGRPEVEAQRRLNARRPTRSGRGRRAHEAPFDSASTKDGFISPDDLPKFGSDVVAFDQALEKHVVDRGWFGERPSKVAARWTGRGVLALVAGGIGVWAGLNIPISGLTLIGAAAIAGGIVILVFSRVMPAVTISGSMIRAMLAAYRRTLQKTMEQARSMDQVVAEAGLPWLDTPDQAVVWGTALGLQSDIEGVLSRSMADLKAGHDRRHGPLFPDVVPELERIAVPRIRRVRRPRQHVLGLGDPGRRRHDVGARDHRELAVIVGQRRWRVRRRWIGRWRRRGRRRLLDPEHVAAGIEALDVDRAPLPRSPPVERHPEALRLPRDAFGREAAEAILLVAERSRHGVRGCVVEERRRLGDPRAETVEREGEHGSPHLLAQPATLVRATEP